MKILFAMLLSLPAHSATLCLPGEKVYFQCGTARGKLISVCGSEKLAGKDSHLQYRFGKPGKPELVYPDQKEGSVKKFFYVLYTRAQTSYQNLSFVNKGSSYTVFSNYDGDEKPAKTYGVQVKAKGAKTDTNVNCLGEPENHLTDVASFVSCDPDDALNMDGCPKP
jgi:hypothetical protein